MIHVTVIHNDSTSTTVALEPAPSILIAFENAGYEYPHGCRVGVCGSCISEVVTGIETLPPADFIERRRLAELRAAERNSVNATLDKEHIRFCCRTALTAGPITLRPLSGTVKKITP
ncbi:MAG: (2Fe-2S)-binding protein [Deltaproteobacteria bacterium]|nr:(2Fe-2S)-binding protein [Deltaproteobacteria bacterium]